MTSCEEVDDKYEQCSDKAARDVPAVVALSADTDFAGLRSSLAPVAASRRSMHFMAVGLNDDMVFEMRNLHR